MDQKDRSYSSWSSDWRVLEFLVLKLQELAARIISPAPRYAPQFLTVQSLEAVSKHWPINLEKKVPSNLDDMVWSNAEEILVKRGMMYLAHCKTVDDRSNSPLFAVGHYVGSVK